ncbi:MAG TPA: YbaN family protein [Salinarimonas sp.]|nr:YbaN family protein [Salinarimonas sp.]
MPDPALPGRAAGVPRPLRWALLALGWLCVGLGIAGLVLPLVPGVVFFILAGACFARSSPRFEAWLLNHRILGPPVASWRRRGAIPRSAKVVACLSMAGSFGLITLTQAPVSVKAGLAVALLGCGLYVATRPEI